MGVHPQRAQCMLHHAVLDIVVKKEREKERDLKIVIYNIEICQQQNIAPLQS